VGKNPLRWTGPSPECEHGSTGSLIARFPGGGLRRRLLATALVLHWRRYERHIPLWRNGRICCAQGPCDCSKQRGFEVEGNQQRVAFQGGPVDPAGRVQNARMNRATTTPAITPAPLVMPSRSEGARPTKAWMSSMAAPNAMTPRVAHFSRLRCLMAPPAIARKIKYAPKWRTLSLIPSRTVGTSGFSSPQNAKTGQNRTASASRAASRNACGDVSHYNSMPSG
jgi:hypothetical protein